MFPDGPLAALCQVLLATQFDKNQFTSREGFSQRRRYYKMMSFDYGQTWTAPERIGQLKDSIHGLSVRSFVMPNGELLINVTYPNEAGSRIAVACFPMI